MTPRWTTRILLALCILGLWGQYHYQWEKQTLAQNLLLLVVQLYGCGLAIWNEVRP